MKVVFTHAYFMYDDPKEQGVNKPYPPLGILYLSSWLEQNGYDNDWAAISHITPLKTESTQYWMAAVSA